MSRERGRILTEYRQSSAAGAHVSRKPRREIEAEALDFELQQGYDSDVSTQPIREASMTVFIFPSDPGIDDDLDWDEPTDEDLLAIDDEIDFDRPFDLGEYDEGDYWPDLDPEDDDDWYDDDYDFEDS